MLSSRFILISLLYLVHTARLVVADPRGGDQFCESVRTVTVVHTFTPNQPSPSSSPANNANPPPDVTQRPGGVNLGNGDNNNKNGNSKSSSVSKNNNKNGNPKTSSTAPPTATPPPVLANGDQNNGDQNNGDQNNGDQNNGDQNNGDQNNGDQNNGDQNNGDQNNGDQNNGDQNNGDQNNGDQNNGGPDTSLTLDPSVIQNINGKAQGDGQVDSLVSTNNFINFCVGKTLSNGKQVKTGSCNPTPMGDIPSVDNMPSAKFNSPKNFDTIPPNTAFTINLQVKNLNTGTFVDPNNAYFAAPQQLVDGIIKGHSHVVVQQMTSIDSTDPLDTKVFSFFKGLNDPAKNGVLSTTVTNGLPAGVYRISSINAAANHQEVVGPVAQRGSFNDAIYITVADGGQNSQAVPSSPPVDPTSSTVPPTSVSSSSIPSDVSSTASFPLPTGTDGSNDNGKNNDVKNNDVSSSEPPVPTSSDGDNGGKGGDPTSSTPPAAPTPTSGDDKSDAKDPGLSSSAAPPDSTSKGGDDPQGGNGVYWKRMHRRSRLA